MRQRKLLFTTTISDCRVETFVSGGPGGQHKNKTQSAVRIVHKESGAVGECHEHRSQHQNKKIAFERMGNSKTFRSWARIEAARRQGQKSTEELVQESMIEPNIKTEIHDEMGRWVVTSVQELKGEHNEMPKM